MDRRTFILQTSSAVATGCSDLGISSTPAESAVGEKRPFHYEGGWFFSAEKMREAYEREYHGEKLLQSPLTRVGDTFVGVHKGIRVEVPQEFVDQILRQIIEMLQTGAALYIFRLDAYHGHLFVTPEIHQVRYKQFDKSRDMVKEVATTLADPDLKILHHTFEHLVTPVAGDPLLDSYKQRNVVGFFNGKPNEILPMPPPPKPSGINTPGRGRIPQIIYVAHKDGLFAIKHPRTGEEVRIDISFDDGTWYF